METILIHRGRPITKGDIHFIRNLVETNPDDHRTALSRKICQAWNWAQPNGHPKDMICRGLLLRLEAEGYLQLPARRNDLRTCYWHRREPERIHVDQSPLQTDLAKLGPMVIQSVRRTRFEKLYNGLIAQFHYLGYVQPVGEHLKYVVFAQERPIACFGWSSAPRHIGCRDRFIGWSAPVRQKNLHLLAYNTRFLILDWIKVPCLASHVLARMARKISLDWQQLYQHPVYFLETFVDTQRFAGTCYRAAGWRDLGQTTGRGKADQTGRPNRSLKTVLGYALGKDFRERLCHG